MSTPSLLSFLDTPIVVGDPDGKAAFVNPAFEVCFGVSAEQVTGEALANLFEGGVREAVLRAVAETCERGVSSRFRVRHAGVGFAALASPIVAEDARVGFVILFLETASEDERIHALQREFHQPVEELARVLEELPEWGGDWHEEKIQVLLEDGQRALGRLRKASDELRRVLAGRSDPGAGPRSESAFEPARLLQAVAARAAAGFDRAGVKLELRASGDLPRVAGDGRALAKALVGLLEQRLEDSGSGSRVTLAARRLERDATSWVVLAVLDAHGPGATPDPSREPEPEPLLRAVGELGGQVRTTADPSTGRTTAIRLPALKQ